MKLFSTRPVVITLLVYGFSRTAQFTLTAGHPGDIGPLGRDFLMARAKDVTTLVRRVDSIASCAFRLDGGDALLLGIPAAEPERVSRRYGLCVVYAVHVSRHKLASAAFLAYMLSALNSYIAQSLDRTSPGPDGVASEYTRLLQEPAGDEAIAFVSDITQTASLFYTSILRGIRRRHGTVSAIKRLVNPDTRSSGNGYASAYTAVCLQAANSISTSRRIQFCYYIPQSLDAIRGSRVPFLPPLHLRVNIFHLLGKGIIIGHSFNRRRGLPVEMHDSHVTADTSSELSELDVYKILGSECGSRLPHLTSAVTACTRTTVTMAPNRHLIAKAVPR